jgi:hypothetical protein
LPQGIGEFLHDLVFFCVHFFFKFSDLDHLSHGDVSYVRDQIVIQRDELRSQFRRSSGLIFIVDLSDNMLLCRYSSRGIFGTIR